MVKKNLSNIIIAVGFNFCANLTIRFSLNRWDQLITVESIHAFKYDHLDISLIYLNIFRYISNISRFYKKIKLTRTYTIYPIFP